MERADAVMRALVETRPYGLRKAWAMAQATFWYTWRYPMPDGKGIGFWYALSGAWDNFLGYLRKPRS